jgi:hypothetical protein
VRASVEKSAVKLPHFTSHSCRPGVRIIATHDACHGSAKLLERTRQMENGETSSAGQLVASQRAAHATAAEVAPFRHQLTLEGALLFIAVE